MWKNIRKLHALIGVVIALPLLVLAITGTLIQFRSNITFLQPKTQTATPYAMPVSFEKYLAASRSIIQADTGDWKSIKMIDYRPSAGVVTIRTKDGYEIQFDAATTAILAHGKRRSSLLMEIHEGGFFGSLVRYGYIVPSGVLLVFIILSGLMMHFRAKKPKIMRSRI